ncbi:bifunctional 2-polyprenyl-6-hydroxyphenol methylase/3-demethylubiquinol 3-O-methyltransferase UbiG [uncultured Bradyrhizobium sp.]|uniref:class I SAM-dependent methyltransferase n=1 Tax=uncultured Bradyrhizobium sp. TaxID=199684 RepID=UPI002630DE8F|nr:class I SAM-dependent methyltransferase [uncultured Bradyrhizobium sp.]
MEQNSLYDHPDLYDLMGAHDPVIERFYVEMASERGGSVLDCGCGSGRLAIPLARAGLSVTGADLSAAMLARAGALARAEAVELDLIQLDMRNFDLERSFDTIILAANAILHLHSLADFEGFFRAAGRHLAPEGRLVFDAFMPNLGLLSRKPGQRELAGAVTHDTLGRLTVEEALRHYDPIAQVSDVEWYWSSEQERDFFTNSWRMRSIFPQEMPLLVASGGLRLVERIGDFDRSPLTGSSRRQICVCARMT